MTLPSEINSSPPKSAEMTLSTRKTDLPLGEVFVTDITRLIWSYLLTSPKLSEYLVPDEPLSSDHERAVFLHNLPRERKVNYDLHPAILRTCKRFYIEALPILYEENEFFYVCMDLNYFHLDAINKRFYTNCSLTRYDPKLFLTPANIPHLSLIKNLTIVRELEKDTETETDIIRTAEPKRLRNLFQNLCRTISKNNLKNLEIHFGPTYVHRNQQLPIISDRQKFIHDLKPLSFLRNVQHCQIKNSDWSVHPIQVTHNLTYVSKTLDKIKNETMRKEELVQVWHMYTSLLTYLRAFGWFNLTGFGIYDSIKSNPEVTFDNSSKEKKTVNFCHEILGVLFKAKELVERDDTNPSSNMDLVYEFMAIRRDILGFLDGRMRFIKDANAEMGSYFNLTSLVTDIRKEDGTCEAWEQVKDALGTYYCWHSLEEHIAKRYGKDSKFKFGWHDVKQVFCVLERMVSMLSLDHTGSGWTGGFRRRMKKLAELKRKYEGKIEEEYLEEVGKLVGELEAKVDTFKWLKAKVKEHDGGVVELKRPEPEVESAREEVIGTVESGTTGDDGLGDDDDFFIDGASEGELSGVDEDPEDDDEAEDQETEEGDDTEDDTDANKIEEDEEKIGESA